MRRVLSGFLFLTTLLAAAPALAEVAVTVDLSGQTMTVAADGAVRHRWAISSGRDGYRTPNGSYRPQRLVRMHYSRKYDNAPMPYAIFFRGGYAIHGTGETGRLGRTASHGCIRLAPGNAATLFSLVQANAGATRIIVTGSSVVADTRRGPTVRRARAEPQWASERPAPRRARGGYGREDDGYEYGYGAPVYYAPYPW